MQLSNQMKAGLSADEQADVQAQVKGPRTAGSLSQRSAAPQTAQEKLRQ